MRRWGQLSSILCSLAVLLLTGLPQAGQAGGLPMPPMPRQPAPPNPLDPPAEPNPLDPAPAPKPPAPPTKLIRDDDGVYTIRLPGDWAVEQDEATLESSNAAETASVSLDYGLKQPQTLQQFSTAVLAHFAQRVVNWQVKETVQVQLAGLPALRTRATGQIDGKAIDGEITAVLSARHQLVIVAGAIGPPFEQHATVLRGIVDSLRFLDGPALPATPPLLGGMLGRSMGEEQAVKAPDGSYSLSLPAGWRHQFQGSNLAASGPQMQAHVRCLVGPKTQRTLQQLSQGVIGAEQQGIPGWTLVSQQQATVAGHPAIETRATVNAQGRQVAATYTCLVTPTHEFAVILSCDAAQAAQHQPALTRILRSWVPVGPAPGPRNAAPGPALPGGQAPGAPAPETGPRHAAPGPALPGGQPPGAPAPQTGPMTGPPDAAMVGGQPPGASAPIVPVPVTTMKQYTDLGNILYFAVPESWKVTPLNAAATAHSPDLRGNLSIMATVRLQMPLEQWAAMLVQQAQGQYEQWKLLGQQVVPVAGGRGLLIRAEIVADGTLTLGETLLFQAGQYQVILVCHCPKKAYPNLQNTFEQIRRSFGFGAPPAAPAPTPRPE